MTCLARSQMEAPSRNAGSALHKLSYVIDAFKAPRRTKPALLGRRPNGHVRAPQASYRTWSKRDLPHRYVWTCLSSMSGRVLYASRQVYLIAENPLLPWESHIWALPLLLTAYHACVYQEQQ